MLAFFQWTAWTMEKPAAYGLFHILMTLGLLAATVAGAYALRRTNERQNRIVLGCVGVFLLLTEVYKIAFHMTVNPYDWGFTYALLADLPADDEERFVPPMRGEFYDIVPFWVDYPTVNKIYSVSVPENKPVQYEFYQGECRSSVRKADGRKLFTFSTSMSLPFKSERNMVALYDVAPKLMLSSTEKWEEKSLWFHKVNEDYGSFEPLPEAQKKVDELLKGVKDNMQKISILTHWVADNMRYSGIPMGKGEGYTLHNTKMNFTDRCGVCKDKAALLISMLRMAGFEAYPAMTMAGSRIETIPADHFNHCVVVVKLEDGTYMPLDPTWVPFKRELWSSAEQQQNYLPGIPEGSDLCLTPVSDPMNHYLKIDAKTTLAADGTRIDAESARFST